MLQGRWTSREGVSLAHGHVEGGRCVLGSGLRYGSVRQILESIFDTLPQIGTKQAEVIRFIATEANELGTCAVGSTRNNNTIRGSLVLY